MADDKSDINGEILLREITILTPVLSKNKSPKVKLCKPTHEASVYTYQQHIGKFSQRNQRANMDIVPWI